MTLRPFIRLLLRYGIGYGEFAQVCKELFVEVADTDFRIADRKQTVSRISVLTGITRREIKHIRETASDNSRKYFPYNHAARVLSSWMNDPEFQDEDGNADQLTASTDGDGTFNKLVLKYGHNTPYRAILDELIRVGAVDVDENGTARMVSTGYVPAKDSEKLLSIAMQSVADHISTIDFNDENKPDTSRLQLAVNYDNVTDDGVEVFRQVSREKCKEILVFLDRFLATQDRDSNPAIKGSGKSRTGIGIFYFEERHDPESND
ncbi:MAG: DUF6502 family protein [Granulosicoccus sp.]